MPTGYAGEGKTFSKIQQKWIKTEKESAFDYDLVNQESASFIISFFRYYPDYLCDLLRSPQATYQLELPQRMMLRINARYRDVYITGCRGLTKTYIILLGKMTNGILEPGVIVRYTAPNQKQAAALATQAFHQIEKDYPLLAVHWKIRNDRTDMFRITTDFGSEFTMYAPRGSNCHEVVAEEIGQETDGGFDMQSYERDVRPTCRLDRKILQKKDRTYTAQKHHHISNACTKTNRAYSIHRANTYSNMIEGKLFDGYVMDIPWEVALLNNLRDINYIKDQRATLTHAAFLREMCAIYTGEEENPMISDEVLARSKRNMLTELRHCGDEKAIYIVSHDVSYADGAKNAKCSDIVLKLTRYKNDETKRDKYRKQEVYADNYPPPPNDYYQAKRIKNLWMKYCLDGGETTYLVVDAQAYGTGVIEELMKPTDDGTPTLCCLDHSFPEIEQKHSLPVILPLKATPRGTNYNDGDMISYAQLEFEQGNVELLTTNVIDGVEQYKRYHRIKDGSADGVIAWGYKQTDLLCQQIANLRVKVSGLSIKEERKVSSIQRDLWSALKYALKMAQILEKQENIKTYKEKSSWADMIENQSNIGNQNGNQTYANPTQRLLGLRRV